MLIEITKQEADLLKNEYERALRLCGNKNIITWDQYLYRLNLIKQDNPKAFRDILNKEQRNLLN